MRRLLTIGGITLLALAVATPALAEPPVHDVVIAKDVAVTVAPPPECPGPGTTIDIVFNQQFHLIFTAETFHLTETLTGTWVSHDAGGATVASGRFVTRTSSQGPGAPTLSDTTLLNATGRTVDGERIRIQVLRHLTITPSGDVTVELEQISCTP